MRLYSPLSREINGEPINTSFDIVLLVIEAFHAPMDELTKIDTAYRLLAKRPREIPIDKKAAFVQDALSELMGEADEPEDDRERTIDFTQDADAIYASFRQAYGIDLIEERGRLDWRKFIALLAGLPQQTLMAQIVQIRTAEVPPINKYNQKDVRRLIQQKARYKINKTSDERERSLQTGLAKLWSQLEGMVKANDGRR